MSLENVKAGDRVIYNGYRLSVEVVDRVTKTMIVIDGVKFRKSDGFMVGDCWFRRGYISSASNDDINKVIADSNARDLREKLCSRTFARVPLEQLIEIESIASKFDKGE